MQNHFEKVNQPGFTTRQLRNASWIIFFSILTTGMGQTLVFAILPSLGRRLSIPEIQIGMIFTASSIVFTACSPIWGRASDRLGRKKVVLIGLFGYTAGTLLFASVFWMAMMHWLQGSVLFLTLVVARMLQSSVMSATNPAATAFMADITLPEQRTVGMGKIGAAHNLGALLGPAVAGSLVFISLLAPLYLAALATLIGALVAWKLLPDMKKDSVSEVPTETPSHNVEKASYFDPRYRHYLIVAVLMFTGFAFVQQTLGFYFQDKLLLSPEEAATHVSLVMMASAIMALISQTFIVQRLNLTPKMLLVLGLPIMTVGYLGLLLGSAFEVYFLAMGLVGLGIGMVVPGFTSGASLTVDSHEQGKVAGLLGAAPAIGFIIGPVLGTALYSLDPIYPYLATVVIFIPLSLGVTQLSNR